MNFNDYFAKRAELTMQVLTGVPEGSAPTIDHRLLAIGGSCLATAAVVQVWASRALLDPGYFALTSKFLVWMLAAGVCVLIGAAIANAWYAGLRVRAQAGLKERTVARLINADKTVAHRLAQGEVQRHAPVDMAAR